MRTSPEFWRAERSRGQPRRLFFVLLSSPALPFGRTSSGGRRPRLPFVLIWLLGWLCWIAPFQARGEGIDPFSLTAEAQASSAFLWRGERLHDLSAQPTLTLSAWNVNLSWQGHIPLLPRRPASGQVSAASGQVSAASVTEEQIATTRFDLGLSYHHSWWEELLHLEGGMLAYLTPFPGATYVATEEIFLQLSLALPSMPALALYGDIHSRLGLYASLTFSHSFELWPVLWVDLSLRGGISGYAAQGQEVPLGFHDLTVTAAIRLQLGPVYLKPFFVYTLSNAYNRKEKARQFRWDGWALGGLLGYSL